ncbi:hypothetical protein D051_6140 [Vibrio parahaemolyticus VPCR-2010]|nr:hypothetical protein D051_6140 [Vibrio parahaemolyticus VPCR-2010]EVU10967.1 hypothetical protein D046_7760 [Vibrio parahaemolyticus V-223/04]EXF67590.1 hypothetical protein D030_4585 [Vibrio parahaemolyticus AQ3810]
MKTLFACSIHDPVLNSVMWKKILDLIKNGLQKKVKHNLSK